MHRNARRLIDRQQACCLCALRCTWTAFWLCWGLLAVQSLAAQETQDDELLQQCYQQPADSQIPSLTFQQYVEGRPTRLYMHSVLPKGQGPPSSTRYKSILTVVTALNAARVDMLLQQCQSWPGPLVAALYVPLISETTTRTSSHAATLDSAEKLGEQALSVVHASQDQFCELQILVMYEYVTTQFLANLIPINALRNAAVLAAKTHLIAMVDVDLVISSELGRQLVTGPTEEVDTKSIELLEKCQRRGVVIMPAFQTPKNRTTNAYPTDGELLETIRMVQDLIKNGTKAAVIKALRARQLIQFASQQFSIGHRRTDFPRWYETSSWYTVQFISQFEPWFITERLHTPFYDVNFRGYGRNKQQQSAHVSAVGMSFWVHPDAYVIHLPHGKSEAQKDHDVVWMPLQQANAANAAMAIARRQMVSGPSSISARDVDNPAGQGHMHVRRVDMLFRRFVRYMAKGQYKSLQDPAALTCLSTLPWWTGNTVHELCTTDPNQYK